jgi:hypothetical protein
LKRPFASAHREVLRRRTKFLRRATSSLGDTESFFRCTSKPIVAPRIGHGHSELVREQRVPLGDDYSAFGNRRDALTRHSQFARGAAKSFRAPRANSLWSSSFSVTLRASSRRREQVSRSSELAQTPPVLGRGARCSLPGCRSSHPAHRSLFGVLGAVTLERTARSETLRSGSRNGVLARTQGTVARCGRESPSVVSEAPPRQPKALPRPPKPLRANGSSLPAPRGCSETERTSCQSIVAGSQAP